MVPFGESHTAHLESENNVYFQLITTTNELFLSPNSLTLSSSGVIVAHFTPMEYFLIASAASIVTWSFVWSRYSSP
jgi:hypothetical protein